MSQTLFPSLQKPKFGYFKLSIVTFNIPILLFFCLGEILLYNNNQYVQLAIAILEYSFLFVLFIFNRQLSIAYFTAFNLLAMGSWSYVTQEELPNNFWGLRFLGLSFNILFTIFLFVACLISNAKPLKILFSNSYTRFFTLFTIYTLIAGVVNVLLGINYLDNFIKDTAVYIPYFFYAYFLYFLKSEYVKNIFIWGGGLTIFSMILSWVINIKFEYGNGFEFVLMNGFAYVMTFAVFFLKDFYTKKIYWTQVIFILLLLVTGNIFLGGKSLINFFVILVWYFSLIPTRRLFLLIAFSLLYFLSPIIIDFIDNTSSKSLLLAYKVSQIIDTFTIADLDVLAATPTSMGNIIAEGKTLYSYVVNNFNVLLFGKGMGGGIPDIYGLFSPLAGPGTAYTDKDIIRNDFFRMHLPVFEILIKAGLFGLLFYLKILYKALKSNSIISFSLFIVLFTVFFNAKEMVLLTLLLIRLSEIEPNVLNNNVNSK